MFGVAREADEGTAVHIWQILMAADTDRGVLRNQMAPADSKAGALGVGVASRRRARSTCTRFHSQPLGHKWPATERCDAIQRRHAADGARGAAPSGHQTVQDWRP